MHGQAIFSPCATYRYLLARSWDLALPRVLFIGCNPSTADARAADPTLRRCMGFARDHGYGGMELVNLFALRATDPKLLKHHPDPIGADNAAILRERIARAGQSVACWGSIARISDQLERALQPLRDTPLVALGVTAEGFPRHPLYVRKDAELMAWRME